LATYGTVARAFVQEVLQNDSSKLKKYHARFIGHVYPGETIILKFWRDSVN
jgi:acyl dehydratase